ncbi:hypothetical protein EDC04DRAFT_1550562 [Pisolithus marmoratus]|nr:hypothetical protein EDC04DRAFT_1550562 [Pisolithus marmoratus]
MKSSIEGPYELRPPRNCEYSSVDFSSSSLTLAKGLVSDKVDHQRGCSVTRLRRICCVLHVSLILIHVVLLVLHTLGLDCRIVVKPQHYVAIPSINFTLPISNTVAANAVTTVVQTVFTLYTTSLVAHTQQLALHRNLLLHQTLTATHDKSAAWNGLGEVLHIFRRRPRAAIGGVVLVALYLCGIAGIGITSPVLFNLETFLYNRPSNMHTLYRMQNLTDLPLKPYWNTATALVQAVGGFTEMPTPGLRNATLHETLSGQALWNATVDAVTFGAQCYSFPNVSAAVANDSSYNITVTCESGENITYPPLYPLYENVTYSIGALGNTVTLLMTPPVLDATGDSGSTFDIPNSFVDSGSMTIQVTTCVLSMMDQTAVIDARTNALVSINRTSSITDSTWTPLQSNLTGTNDHRLDWFQDAWTRSSLSTDYYTPNQCPECFLSFLEQYIMTFLGRSYNATAVNQSAVPTTPNTLHELETAMAHVASAAAWAVLTTSGYYNKSNGETSVTEADLKSQLKINTTPVAVGIAISTVLLVLSILLTREPPSLSPDSGVQAANAIRCNGFLEVIWLSSRHSMVQEHVVSVEDPSPEELRKAGLFHVVLGHATRSNDFEKSSKGE